MTAEASAARTPNVHVQMDGRPENVALVREVLDGVGRANEIADHDLDDIKTAVTEACNNAVQHAYASGEAGPVEVDVDMLAGAMEVTVRDRGPGMQPTVAPRSSGSLGIGVLVIKALAESVTFSDREEYGLEVRMRFMTPGTCDTPSVDGMPALALASSYLQPARSVSISIGPPPLALAILPRLLCALASRAHFSTDRIADLEVLGDAVARHAGTALAGTHVTAGIAMSDRSMRLTVGPLRESGAERMIADSSIAGVGPLIERLSDICEVRNEKVGEILVLQVDDPSRR